MLYKYIYKLLTLRCAIETNNQNFIIFMLNYKQTLGIKNIKLI